MLLLLSFSLCAAAKAQQIFYWRWQAAGDSVHITGAIGTDRIIVPQSLKLTRERFVRLCYIIDEIEYKKLEVYHNTADTLSDLLIKPFANELKKCSSIYVEIDSSLLNFSLEFLAVNKMPLAIYKPMLFTINGFVNADTTQSFPLHRGFIVRDKTSDPEKACINIFHQFPKSEFKDAYSIYQKDLGLKKNTDFILFSAHGDADSLTFRGGIGLNKIDNVDPEFFKMNDPALVYLDGCQQGINRTYISAPAQTEKTNFYLGPLVSNDSGESSTRTINWFFDYLKQTKDPVVSLFKTRQRLFVHYNGHIKQMDVINKSFIFRVYKL